MEAAERGRTFNWASEETFYFHWSTEKGQLRAKGYYRTE